MRRRCPPLFSAQGKRRRRSSYAANRPQMRRVPVVTARRAISSCLTGGSGWFSDPEPSFHQGAARSIRRHSFYTRRLDRIRYSKDLTLFIRQYERLGFVIIKHRCFLLPIDLQLIRSGRNRENVTRLRAEFFCASGRRAVSTVEGAAHQKWSITQEAFDRLLAALDPDRDTAAQRYLEMRRNLVRLFEWRGCSTPDEYADETINRCARKIVEGEEIRDLGSYSVGVARMLVREMGRERSKEAVPLEKAPEPRILPAELESDHEARIGCLRRCLSQLTSENRELIVSYYKVIKATRSRIARG